MDSGVLDRGIVVALRLQIAVVRGPTRIVGLPGLMSKGGLFVVGGTTAQCVELSVDDGGADDARACVNVTVEFLKNGGVGGGWD